MKDKSQSKKSGGKTPTPPTHATVHLELEAPGAVDVCLAGSFNDWHPGATPMVNLGNGRWAKEIVLTPGRYEYLFVVDGRWQPDPTAEQALNPFGGTNCVLNVSL